MSNDIEQWDALALRELWQSGAMSLNQIMNAVTIDQFDLDTANAWVDSALERELVELTGGSGGSARFNITDAGRTAIGVPVGR